MIRADDPRVTAYALGEGDEAERLAVEAAMAVDPEVRDAVASVRAVAQAAAAALATHAPAGLTDVQRTRVLRATARPARATAPVPTWRRWAAFGAAFGAAASLLAAIGVSLLAGGGGGSAGGIESPATGSGPGADAYRQAASGRGDRLPAEGASEVVEEAPEVDTLYELDVVPKTPDAPPDHVLELLGGSAGIPSPAAAAPTGPTSNGLIGLGGGAVRRVHVLDARGDPAAPMSGYLAGVPNTPTTPAESAGGEAYDGVVEADFVRVADQPLSTFSVDVDTASYANVRRMLRDGMRPPADAVRVEEMVNYFRYAYPAPTGADPFAVHLEAATCPWNAKHRLVRVALQGREMARAARPAMNLVFLLDVSGSMNQPNKLPLVQASMRMLLEELQERDTVAIVVYAGSSGLVLPPTSCERKADIQRAIDDLRASGSTNGAAGIQLAYDTARAAFIRGGVNRVVLATDGDFNVGVTSREGLLALIEAQAKSGVFLTCLGYGMGNLKDATLEMLADKGNGNYGYVDSTREARKVLVDDASGTLVTIAKDVKIQVEFNPATVAAYRLVGYDNRRLAARDFADDTKDAGEVGAGHAVTAFYEVVPVGGDVPAAGGGGEEPLRYGPKPASATAPTAPAGEVVRETLTVKVRWKEPTGATSTKREVPFTDAGADYAKASADYRFAAAVAAFALVLKDSAHRGTATLEAVAELATEGLAQDPGGYRAEFMDLVAHARRLLPGR
jgi:Ca-activated chloride channel family protein